MSEKSKFPKQGEIWLVKCDKIKEISKDYRPVLIISNDIRNEFDESVATVTITTENLENVEPYEVFINNIPEIGLDHPSKILCDCPFTFNKELRLVKKLGVANKKIMSQVKIAWQIAFNWEE